MVISHLGFMKYLGIGSKEDADAIKRLPRAADVDPSIRQGDFDLLIIHRLHGLIIGEVKSVQKTEHQSHGKFLEAVVRRMEKAVGQLDKAETVLKKLVSDVSPRPAVTKMLVLPYITSAELREALQTDAAVSQASPKQLFSISMIVLYSCS